MGTSIRLLAVLAVVLAACSPSSSDSTTTTGPATEPTDAPAAATTQPAETTTTVQATTTTEEALDANAMVEAKTAAVLAALPEGWTGDTEAAVTDAQNDDVAYEPCLLPDDFDIDNLDDVSAAALVASFEGPNENPPFGAPRGSIEARVFNSDAEAEAAFAVFSRIWGTPEGLECMTNSVLNLMGEDVPIDDLTITTESVSVAGSQAGARFEMAFDVQGFTGAVYVEFQGARNGECTTIASFITFAEPFDRDVADAVFQAAASA